MRKKRDSQRSLLDLSANWNKAKELAKIDQILSENPTLCDLVAQDLATPGSSKAGAPGMTAEQVLRVTIVKQYYQFSYRTLEDRIDDSYRLRSFCRFGHKKIPRFNTLAENVKRIRPETWSQINTVLVRYAVEQKVEPGRKVRIDTAAVESDIHYPTDSRLIEDCVRVCTRLMTACRECFGDMVGSFRNRTRSVKKRTFLVANTKSSKKRHKARLELLKIGSEVRGGAQAMRDRLAVSDAMSADAMLLREELLRALDEVLPLFGKVLDQGRRRIVDGETVPATEKIVSIFEPHTDIIQKGARDTVFGHKVCFVGGASNLILDCKIESGNPADASLLLEALERTEGVLGKMPRQVAADDGFASTANAERALKMGVEDIAFGGKLPNELTRWVRSAWVQKMLRRFRAGIEGVLSAGKRAFGLTRCTWRGWPGFQTYVWASLVAWNLQVLARHLLC